MCALGDGLPSLSSSTSLLPLLCQSITAFFPLIFSYFPHLVFLFLKPLSYSILHSCKSLQRPGILISMHHLVSSLLPNPLTYFPLLSFFCLSAHPPDCLLLSHNHTSFLPPSSPPTPSLSLRCSPSPLSISLSLFSRPKCLHLSSCPKQSSDLFFFSPGVAFFQGFPSESPFPRNSPTFASCQSSVHHPPALK